MVVTFLISALAHELVMVIVTKKIRYLSFSLLSFCNILILPPWKDVSACSSGVFLFVLGERLTFMNICSLSKYL